MTPVAGDRVQGIENQIRQHFAKFRANSGHCRLAGQICSEADRFSRSRVCAQRGLASASDWVMISFMSSVSNKSAAPRGR